MIIGHEPPPELDVDLTLVEAELAMEFLVCRKKAKLDIPEAALRALKPPVTRWLHDALP